MSPGERPSPEVEARFPVPFCPLSKMVGEHIQNGDCDLYLLALSCDASRRTRDILEALFPQKTFLSLEVPLGDSVFALERFSRELRRVGKILADRQGLSMLDLEMRLSEVINRSFAERHTLSALFFAGKLPPEALLHYKLGEGVSAASKPATFLLTGSHCFIPEVLALLAERGVSVVEETPAGARRWVVLPSRGELVPSLDPFLDLARLYLHYKLPCPRDWEARMKALQELITCSGVRGIVYLYSKFCDFTLYDLAWIRKHFALPFLPLEHDLTPNLPQWVTRLDAFLEANSGEEIR